ncbi:urease accessory protein UreD [Oceaniglobus roseus]|uniref:urease accessory protein UreD n=1 Tax=Oceaniglobus roseus TaxID=1737570 RepID=UPI000C7E8ED6|nr:urease accessory protein UreD [Kandeliimicrobium roseum]
MLDNATTDLPKLQRTRGAARVRLDAAGLRDLHQSGSAKAMLPKMHGAPPEVVFLNTAGGLTGGDRMHFALNLGPGARATGTTQTAERAYAARDEVAEVTVDLDLGRGARLDWLPQETILFQSARLSRRTTAQLAAEATLLMAETVVLGRTAMGETLTTLDFTDRRRVLRLGRPVLIEPLRITGADLAARGAAGLDGALALTTVALVSEGAEDALGPVRDIIGEAPGLAASAWDGRLIVRAMGRDALAQKRRIAAIIERLRGAALPRVWQV